MVRQELPPISYSVAFRPSPLFFWLDSVSNDNSVTGFTDQSKNAQVRVVTPTPVVSPTPTPLHSFILLQSSTSKHVLQIYLLLIYNT
jgi:hypothetical protein